MLYDEESYYDFELERVNEWLKRSKINKILVQMPDGLKKHAPKILEYLTEKGYIPILSGSHTWGGCDIAEKESESIGADAIIHFGHHAPVWLYKKRVISKPVCFIPVKCRLGLSRMFEKILRELSAVSAKRVALTAALQHIHEIPNLARMLAGEGLDVYIAKSRVEAMKPGQIIGCDAAAAKKLDRYVDVHICVAGGLFHPLAASLMTIKPVIRVDPYMSEVDTTDIKREKGKLIKIKTYRLIEAFDAKLFYILVSTKTGQLSLETAIRIRKKLSKKDIKSIIVTVDDITAQLLENLPEADAFINTACPHIGIESIDPLNRPILNIGEIKYLLAESLNGYSSKDWFKRSLGS